MRGERVCGFDEVELALAMSLHVLHEGWQHYGVEEPELLHRVPRELQKERRTVVLVPTATFEDYHAGGSLAGASELVVLMNAALPPGDVPDAELVVDYDTTTSRWSVSAAHREQQLLRCGGPFARARATLGLQAASG